MRVAVYWELRMHSISDNRRRPASLVVDALACCTQSGMPAAKAVVSPRLPRLTQ